MFNRTCTTPCTSFSLLGIVSGIDNKFQTLGINRRPSCQKTDREFRRLRQPQLSRPIFEPWRNDRLLFWVGLFPHLGPVNKSVTEGIEFFKTYTNELTCGIGFLNLFFGLRLRNVCDREIDILSGRRHGTFCSTVWSSFCSDG